MYRFAIALLLLATLFETGCLSGRIERAMPRTPMNTENRLILDQSKDEVWARFIPGMAQTFFVVNNLDKESGFINVSYTGDPEKYVDGGEVHSWTKILWNRSDYRFPAVRAHAEYEMNDNGQLIRVVRRMQLEGRINITVEELDLEETAVTVTTRYILTKSGEVSRLVVDANYRTHWVPHPFSETIAFNTGSEGYFSSDRVPYRPNGKLEQDVLNVLR